MRSSHAPPAVESYAESGSLGENSTISLQVELPNDALKDFGYLEMSFSSSAIQTIADALIYMYNYHFDSNEQISSRLIALACFHEILSKHKNYKGTIEVGTFSS